MIRPDADPGSRVMSPIETILIGQVALAQQIEAKAMVLTEMPEEDYVDYAATRRRELTGICTAIFAQAATNGAIEQVDVHASIVPVFEGASTVERREISGEFALFLCSPESFRAYARDPRVLRTSIFVKTEEWDGRPPTTARREIAIELLRRELTTPDTANTPAST